MIRPNKSLAVEQVAGQQPPVLHSYLNNAPKATRGNVIKNE